MAKDIVTYRDWGNDAAVVFLHGFMGKATETWQNFPWYLANERSLIGWDVYSLGYESSLRLDIPGIWTANPDLSILAKEFETALSLAPFVRYKALVIVAHSMGGLIAQRALLNSTQLTGRIQHLFLFGTPSNGLVKAGLGRWFSRQAHDMDANGTFIAKLKSDRAETWFGSAPRSFGLHAVAGNLDQFVPPNSSIDPFPSECQVVIHGNHLDIVKPDSPDHDGVKLVKAILEHPKDIPSVVDGAKIAIEQRHFQKAIAVLRARRPEELDDRAQIDLALALDGVGQGAEALALLEKLMRGKRHPVTDALGVLAGRLKRRWLAERRKEDWTRAHSLYAQALEQAEAVLDREQAYYHAINVAFLDLMITQEDTPVPDAVRQMALRAVTHCDQAADSQWNQATRAEAALMRGDLDAALTGYAAAITRTRSPREIDSMYSQAFRVADRVHGEDGATRIEKLFNPYA